MYDLFDTGRPFWTLDGFYLCVDMFVIVNRVVNLCINQTTIKLLQGSLCSSAVCFGGGLKGRV